MHGPLNHADWEVPHPAVVLSSARHAGFYHVVHATKDGTQQMHPHFTHTAPGGQFHDMLAGHTLSTANPSLVRWESLEHHPLEDVVLTHEKINELHATIARNMRALGGEWPSPHSTPETSAPSSPDDAAPSPPTTTPHPLPNTPGSSPEREQSAEFHGGCYLNLHQACHGRRSF
jgi:hypothetical protein